MMRIDADTVIAVTGLAASLLPVVGGWLRLHFHLRHQQERRRYLLAAAALPAGSRLHERHSNGSVLVVTVGGPHRAGLPVADESR